MLSFVEDILLFLTSNFLLFGILVITLVSFLSFLCFLLATILSIRDKTKYYSRLKSIQWSSDKFSFVQELNSLNKLVNEWFDKNKTNRSVKIENLSYLKEIAIPQAKQYGKKMFLSAIVFICCSCCLFSQLKSDIEAHNVKSNIATTSNDMEVKEFHFDDSVSSVQVMDKSKWRTYNYVYKDNLTTPLYAGFSFDFPNTLYMSFLLGIFLLTIGFRFLLRFV
jgi:hypothetical protein